MREQSSRDSGRPGCHINVRLHGHSWGAFRYQGDQNMADAALPVGAGTDLADGDDAVGGPLHPIPQSVLRVGPRRGVCPEWLGVPEQKTRLFLEDFFPPAAEPQFLPPWPCCPRPAMSIAGLA